jgi:tetratricopeptide (TPR) repeat protein
LESSALRNLPHLLNASAIAYIFRRWPRGTIRVDLLNRKVLSLCAQQKFHLNVSRNCSASELIRVLIVVDVSPHRLMARALIKQGQWDKALATLQSAQILSPSNPEHLVLIGDASYGKGDLNKAPQCYEEARELDPNRVPHANRRMGQNQVGNGCHRGGAQALEEQRF